MLRRLLVSRVAAPGIHAVAAAGCREALGMDLIIKVARRKQIPPLIPRHTFR
jgi:hypothetical protein